MLRLKAEVLWHNGHKPPKRGEITASTGQTGLEVRKGRTFDETPPAIRVPYRVSPGSPGAPFAPNFKKSAKRRRLLLFLVFAYQGVQRRNIRTGINQSMGIAVGRWAAEPWKDMLAHHGRIAHVCAEFAIAQDDEATFPYSGELFSVFESSFVMAAFAIRRLSEKRLLTDRLNGQKWSVTSYPATAEVRPPLPSSTSNGFYHGYRFDKLGSHTLTLKEFGHEVIHSSNLGIVTEPEGPPCGILVASDFRLGHRVLHITLKQWETMCRSVLDDRVYVTGDRWDPDTGAVTAERLGREDLGR